LQLLIGVYMKNKNMILSVGFLGLLFTIMTADAASYHTSYGVGGIANQLFGEAMGIRQIVRVICIVTGTALIFGSVIQYRKHRRNPIETPMGSVFMLLITGAALIALSFIPFVPNI
jgi:hypothetical protein